MSKTRIRLLTATLEDAEEIVRTIDPGSLQNFEFLRAGLTVEGERNYLRKMYTSPSDYFYLIRKADTGTLLGAVGLHDVDIQIQSARIGISLFREEFRGQGFGSEAMEQILEVAFRNLRLHEVNVNVFVENVRAQKRNATFGFRPAGILKEYYRLDTECKDMVHMTLCRCRWEDTQKGRTA